MCESVSRQLEEELRTLKEEHSVLKDMVRDLEQMKENEEKQIKSSGCPLAAVDAADLSAVVSAAAASSSAAAAASSSSHGAAGAKTTVTMTATNNSSNVAAAGGGNGAGNLSSCSAQASGSSHTCEWKLSELVWHQSVRIMQYVSLINQVVRITLNYSPIIRVRCAIGTTANATAIIVQFSATLSAQ